MKYLMELRRKVGNKIEESRALLDKAKAENRDMNEEERAAYDALQTEIDYLTQKIKDEERQQALEDEQRSANPQNQPNRPQPGENRGEDGDSVEYRNFGAFISDVYEGNTEELRAHNITSASSLGWQVPTQFESGAFSLKGPDTFIKSRAHVIPAGEQPDAAYKKIIEKQGLGGFYHGFHFSVTGEEQKGDEKESEKTYIEIYLDPMKCKVTGHTYISEESLANAEATSADLEQSFKLAYAAYEERLFLKGTGVKQPLGVLNSKGALKIGRKTANKFTYEDFLKMKKQFYGNPLLILTRDLYDVVGLMTDGSGQLIFKAGDISKGLPDTLGGVPIKWTYSTVTTGLEGDAVMVDWSYYWVKEGSGPYVKINPYEKFDEDMIKLKIASRIDAMFIIPEPVKHENGMMVSPLVILKKEAA